MGPLNSSLSNLPWHAPHEPKDKRRSLVQHSLLKLNTTVVHDYPERFDENSVDDRSTHLTELITQLWPGPEGEPQISAEYKKPAEDGDTANKTAPQRRIGAASPDAPSRDAIREELQQGRTSDQIADAAVDIRTAWFLALEEEARLAGELNTIEPSAENVAWLRDERHLRWERISVRIYGDAGRVNDARRLYEQSRGAGAAKRSYTCRGRRFPDMDP